MKIFSIFCRRIAMVVVAVVCFSALSACDYLPFGFVSVREIVQNPSQFDGRKIKVKGIVSDVTKIPFLKIRFYALKDEGYQIMVVAKETIPAANKEIAVVGVVENFAIVGNESLGLHLSEIKRLDHVFY